MSMWTLQSKSSAHNDLSCPLNTVDRGIKLTAQMAKAKRTSLHPMVHLDWSETGGADIFISPGHVCCTDCMASIGPTQLHARSP